MSEEEYGPGDPDYREPDLTAPLLVSTGAWMALEQRAELAERKVTQALERLRALLACDEQIGNLWGQDREMLLGVVMALEVG